MTSRDAVQARVPKGPSLASFDAGSRCSARECFDHDSEERRGVGRRRPGCIVRGEPGIVCQRLVPGGDVRLDISDAVRALTGKAAFRARFRRQPERFAERTAAKPRVIEWPCWRPGYREIRPDPSPDDGTEGSTTQMSAPGRDFAQIRCPAAGFAGFVSEFFAYSRVAVSTTVPICYAAPDLPYCQRGFSPLCWTPCVRHFPSPLPSRHGHWRCPSGCCGAVSCSPFAQIGTKTVGRSRVGPKVVFVLERIPGVTRPYLGCIWVVEHWFRE